MIQIIWVEQLLNTLFSGRKDLFLNILFPVNDIDKIKKKISTHSLEASNDLSKKKGFQTYKQRYKDLFGISKKN